MAKKIYKFKTCVNDYLGLNNTQGTTYYYTFVSNTTAAGNNYTYSTGEKTYLNVKTSMDNTYASDPLLNGKIKAIGYGWQKYVIERTMNVEIMIRGACGGHSATTSSVLSYTGTNNTSSLGVLLSNGNYGGRGAKLIGDVKLNKDDILYLAVGMRGWCQNRSDYGGTGGGASVILRVNPLGDYTFVPTGEKVDVIMIAGGGGGAYDSGNGNSDTNPNHNGKDASYLNGSSTNAGNSDKPGGGGGLVGDSSKYPGYSLLSGTPSSTIANSIHYGAWPGGSGSYNGGGGGSGYSGGNATDDKGGGYGGTSYINPNYVTEKFRGYEYDQSMNPWSIPGSIIMTIGRDGDEYILAKDSEGTKYFNYDILSWELIPNQGILTPTDYETYGIADIENVNGLLNNVTFLASSPHQEKKLFIDGKANKLVITSDFEIDMTSIHTIKNWTITGYQSSISNIKLAVSIDHGQNYKILIDNTWTNIDINDKSLFYSQGININDLTTIASNKWKELNATNLRFAFLIHQLQNSNNPVLTNIKFTADLVGGWRKAIHPTDYDYEYKTSESAIITINTAGDYKINYLDRISS